MGIKTKTLSMEIWKKSAIVAHMGIACVMIPSIDTVGYVLILFHLTILKVFLILVIDEPPII